VYSAFPARVEDRAMDDTPPLGRSVLGAAWHYRWQVLITIAAFAGLSFAYGTVLAESWTTTASLVVQDPRGQQLFSSGDTQSPERYVQDQVAILESAATADLATQLAAQVNPPVMVTTKEVLDHRGVTARSSGNLIQITYRAEDPDAAMAVANAIAQAYQQTRRQDSVAESDAALNELDRSLAAVDEELAAVQSAIADWTASNPARSELERQYQDALARLIELPEPDPAATLEERDAYRAELADILSQLQTLQLANSLQPEDPELAALLASQAEAQDRRSQLAARRDQIEIDARLASTGVVLFSPARFVEPAGIGLLQTLVVGITLGGLLGVGGAYLATLRNRWFGRRDEPELILGAPLLAEVPDFSEERSKSVLPVRDAPTSVSAEAFQFVAAAIEVRFSPITATPATPAGSSPSEESRPRLFVVTSARLGEGKTVVTANTAIAAARRGSRVLVIDGDLKRPALTRLMLSRTAPVRGLTDVLGTGLTLSRAIATFAVSDAVRVDVLARGVQQVNAPDFFRSVGARELFETVRGQYDLVLIDSPPLLQEAYASTLAGYADRVIVVVPHRSRVSLLEDEQDRLTLIGTPLAGYVYNRAPLRPEMAGREAR
jgi:Mrp family chromosome partitioning ATPase/uncharacterized protein involved in exopolysaccharide biosynthesis